ncbi:GNAT family N-acetyltransferase [Dactylosporangium vinaceum]|uniref:GNAT family N-acetyltransferase n=1 Tax=Dactylosporangium vinaceum TaxID=53362 RepID=A0ABV5MRJ9_9ACTN|nr:GNAT family N-acetyltransferase [Dactylosporangium vinaceum]UAC00432.1 GNAT family N-acetyltransferase [Dactylosporangium vinaceum]
MLIRAKGPHDAAECLELLLEVHRQDHYPLHITAEQVPEFLESGHEAAAWVAEHDGRIVGHVALHTPDAYPTLELAGAQTGIPVGGLALLARLFVAPSMRRTGLGRRLLRHAAGHAPALGRRAVLDVGMQLATAVALYESEGWARVGELHLPLDPDTMLDLWVYVSP